MTAFICSSACAYQGADSPYPWSTRLAISVRGVTGRTGCNRLPVSYPIAKLRLSRPNFNRKRVDHVYSCTPRRELICRSRHRSSLWPMRRDQAERSFARVRRSSLCLPRGTAVLPDDATLAELEDRLNPRTDAEGGSSLRRNASLLWKLGKAQRNTLQARGQITHGNRRKAQNRKASSLLTLCAKRALIAASERR